jgi:hypothetical protein
MAVTICTATADSPNGSKGLLIAGSFQPGQVLAFTLASTRTRSEMKTLFLTGATVAVLAAATPAPATAQPTKPLSQVVEWNRTLLVIVRTPGAQPATIHPTRSFAIMHAAMYDAVNTIDGTHKPYLVRLSASHFASQEAASAAASHEVLVSCILASRRHSILNFSRR